MAFTGRFRHFLLHAELPMSEVMPPTYAAISMPMLRRHHFPLFI
jgi:hypothetical protein